MPISFQVILMFSLLKQNWEEKYLRLAISLILLSLLLYFFKKKLLLLGRDSRNEFYTFL